MIWIKKQPQAKNRGAIAIESADGRDLCYIEAVDRPSPVWRVSLSGGTPVKAVE